MLQQFVSCLPGKRLEIAHRSGVGRKYSQYLARLHVIERLLGAQDRQRTIQSPGVEVPIEHNLVVVWHNFVLCIRRQAKSSLGQIRRHRERSITTSAVNRSENADSPIQQQTGQAYVGRLEA